LEFYDQFLKVCQNLATQGKPLILCGDFNTAHTAIDLARPKENEKNTGFLPEEREWITRIINAGFIDTFRHFHAGPDHYTWWDYKTRARQRNVGWRIDYFFISQGFKEDLRDAFILKDVYGSDHCPLGIRITDGK
jgi:exodeoxyribonuclease-3